MRIKYTVVFSFLFCLIFVSLADDASVFLDDAFKSGKLENYIRKTSDAIKVSVDVPGGDLMESTESFTFKPMPVEGGEKYKLTFKGAFNGQDCIENNPLFNVYYCRQENMMPVRAISFYNEKMEDVTARYRITFGMPFKAFHEYVDVFYAPPEAKYMSMEIRIPKGGDSSFVMTAPKLELAKDDGAINCNPDFALGEYNYSAFPNANNAGARLFKTPSGKTVFDSAYGSSTAAFPFLKKGTYRLFAKAEQYGGGYSDILLRIYDKDGKEVLKRSLRRNPEGEHIYFILPDDAVFGDILVYNSILEEVRLTWVGDESEFKKLQDAEKKK